VEKYGRAKQATDNHTIWRMRFELWISKATTQSQNMQYSLLFHGNDGYANAPQCYVYMYSACLVCFGIRSIVRFK